MSGFKYVCFDQLDYRLFPMFRNHRDEAARIPEMQPTSAGFVRMTAEGLECYGESTSLGLQADPRDTERLNTFMRGE